MLEDLSILIVTTLGFTIVGAAGGIALTVNNVMDTNKSIVYKAGLSTLQTVGLTGVGAFTGLIVGAVIVGPKESENVPIGKEKNKN